MKKSFLSLKCQHTVLIALLTSFAVFVPRQSVRADDLYWDADGNTTAALGGNGSWDLTSALWRNGSTTGALQTWTSVSDAYLGGTVGTLTLSSGIFVNDIFSAPSSGTFTISGAQILQLGGASKSVLDVASGSTLTISSGLAGTNGLTKSSAGTLIMDTIAGSSRLSGDITLNSGTLQVGTTNATLNYNIGSQALRSNAVTLSSGTSLTTGTATGTGASSDLRVGSLSGGGTITQTATNGATLNIHALVDASSGATISNSGGTNVNAGINVRGANGTTQTFSGNLTGVAGTIGINSGATLKLTGTGTTNGVLGPNTGTATTIALRGGGFTMDNSGGNSTATNGRLSDGTAFTFLGGTVALVGNSAGSSETVGTTTFNAGANTISVTNNGGTGTQLTFTDSGSLRDTSRVTVNFVGTGGTLGATGANPRISFTGALSTNTTNGMLANSSSTTVQTTGWAVANGISWAGANASNSIIALADTARNSTTLASAASQELVGFAPSTTTTTLSANLGTSATVGIGALKISPTASGQTLAVGGNSIFTPALMLTGTTDFSITGTSAGGMQIGSSTRYVWVTEEGTALNYGAGFASTGPINKSGAGILNLNAAFSQLPAANINLLQGVLRGTTTSLGGSGSSSSANTTINMRGGVLEISGGGTLTRALLTAGAAGGGAIDWDNGGSNRGDGGFSAVGGNATVSLVTTAGGPTAATPVWNDGAFVANGYALLMGSTKADSRIDFTNNIGLDDTVIAGGAANNYFAREIRVADNTGSTSDVARLSGVISGSANADLLKTGAGVLELTGTNTFSGNILLSAGTLRAGNIAALGGGSATTSVGSGASLELNGFNNTIGALTGSGTVRNNSATTAATLTAGSGGGSSEFSGTIENGSTATMGLSKTGIGILTLSGGNSYTGSTGISQGTLEIGGTSGSLSGTTGISIAGGTLLMSGSAANRVNNSATVSIGGAADSKLQLSGSITESLGALTLSSGLGNRVIDFGAGAGVLTVESITAGSSLPIQIWNWSGTTGSGGGTDQFIISSGVLGGSLSLSDISFYSGSGTGLYSGATKFASGGELVPVPEVGALFGVLGLMAPLAWRERRHWMRCREARGI